MERLEGFVGELLDLDEIKRRAESGSRARAAPDVTSHTSAGRPPIASRFIRPLEQAAELLIENALNPDARFKFGVFELDTLMRGVGSGELCFVTGRPGSGKSQLLLNAVANNADKRILWVTPDETAEQVLVKLMGLVERVKFQRLEERLGESDEETLEQLRQFAKEQYPNLLVVDKTVDVDQLSMAVEEATHHWGDPPELVVYDYLELLPGEGGSQGTSDKARGLKAWGGDLEVPLVIIHQASKGGGKRGRSAGMDGMMYAGAAEATYVVEVYRRQEDDSLSEYELQQEAATVNVALVKNKRPPGHKGDLSLFMHPDYGYIRTIEAGDVGTPQERSRRQVGGRGESMGEAMNRIAGER